MSTYSISQPAAAGTSCLQTVSGVWEKRSDFTAKSEVIVDVIARLETPPPDFDHSTSPSTPLSNEHNPPSFATAPPPYAPRDCDMMYTDGEPLTLARMLFLYGFFFFPFWLAGVYILYSPLLPTPDWEAGKTEDEKAYLLRLLRETELKWARRCLYALHGLLVTAFIFFIIIKYGIMGTI